MEREIVGFAADDRLAFSQTFPEEQIRELRKFLEYGDDEDLINVYSLPPSALARVAEILGTKLPPSLDYFLETSG